MQPKLDEIKRALDDLAQCISIVGAEAEARQKLRQLREAKTTWVGKEENDLRFTIIRALES